MAACFFLLFNPPASLGQTELFLWLTAFAVLVRVSMTLNLIPSNSMVAEMTPHYDERTSLVSYRFFFGWAGGIAMYQLALRVFLAETPEFGDGRYNADGYGGFALVGALGIAAAILICAVGTHRLIPSLKPPPEKTPLTVGRFFRELREVFGNRSYLMLVFAGLFASVAGGFSDVVGLYVNSYFWGFSAQEIAFLGLAAIPGVLVAVSLARPISERFDKKRAALGLATFAILFGALPVLLRLVELMPPNGHPLLLYLISGHSVLIVTTIIIIMIVLSSMIADTMDVGELRTGKRQEGMYASAVSFTGKAVSGIGGFLAGIALDLIDFPRTSVDGVAPTVAAGEDLRPGPGRRAGADGAVALLADLPVALPDHARTPRRDARGAGAAPAGVRLRRGQLERLRCLKAAPSATRFPSRPVRAGPARGGRACRSCPREGGAIDPAEARRVPAP